MATPSLISSGVSLLALPPELLSEVWKHLSHADFKSLRLLCRASEKMASPALFHTFILYPHTESLSKLQEVSKSARLAFYIHKVVYDCTFWLLLDSAMGDLQNIRERTSLSGKDLISVSQRLTSQSLDFKSAADQFELVLSLQQIFLRLPNLTTISILEDDVRPRDVPLRKLGVPAFYSRIFGEDVFQAIQQVVPDIDYNDDEEDEYEEGSLVAMLFSITCLARPLKKFQLITRKAGWMGYESHFGKFARCNRALAALDVLYLACTHDAIHLDFSNTYNLQNLLKQATSLTKLVLVMGTIRGNVQIFEREWVINYAGGPSHREYGPTFHPPPARSSDSCSDMEFRLNWSTKIKNLTLGGLKCTNNELEEILKHHTESLEVLKLSDLLLMPPKQEHNAARGCLVKLFKWLRNHLNLKSVSFDGTLTNLGMQHWIIRGEKGSPTGLYQMVTSFIVDGGECPLDFVEILPEYYDLGLEKFDDAIPWFLGHREFKGDSGWQMKYYYQGKESKGSGDPQIGWDDIESSIDEDFNPDSEFNDSESEDGEDDEDDENEEEDESNAYSDTMPY